MTTVRWPTECLQYAELVPNHRTVPSRMKKKYRFSEILYAPNLLENRSVAMGIILWDPEVGGLGSFVEVSKRTDWSAIVRLDPDADTEFLSAAVDQIEQDFRQRDEAGRERLIAQLSMNITLTDPREIETNDPGETLNQLARARGL